MMTCTAKELCAATGGTLVPGRRGLFLRQHRQPPGWSQGCLFIPLVGERFDGHTYLTQALESGAAAACAAACRRRWCRGSF